MAVELAKLSIWIFTLQKGRKLEFFDYNLRCGDSLIGSQEKTFSAHVESKSKERMLFASDEELYQNVINDFKNEFKKYFEFESVEDRIKYYESVILPSQQKLKFLADVELAIDFASKDDKIHLVYLHRKNELLQTIRMDAKNEYLPKLAKGKDTTNWEKMLYAHAKKIQNEYTPIHWELDFPNVSIDKGGFDAVIGNPPYGILINKNLEKYYSKYFEFADYKINLYILFIEKILRANSRGLLSFIIPKSILFNKFFDNLRRYLLMNYRILELFTLSEKVFEQAEVGDSLILKINLSNRKSSENLIKMVYANTFKEYLSGKHQINEIKQSVFLENYNYEISIISNKINDILNKIKKNNPINKYFSLKNGLNPGNIKHILISTSEQNSNYKKIVWGKDISRYKLEWSGEYINYDNNIHKSLSLDEVKSKSGMNKQNRIDYALRDPSIFEVNKIMLRKTDDSLIASYDQNNYYFDTLIHGIYESESKYSLKFLLCILNSKPSTLFYRMLHDIKGKVFAKISLDNISMFPIPKVDGNQQTPFINRADIMLAKNKELQELNNNFWELFRTDVMLENIPTKLEKWYC
ncbi:MAG: Eco57I restriction-modification methylase domain-containing protein [Leptospiraceae bacterium]|nr:Eco57I restriction-modification methylase domain-containing protein [Leptospiraceae bacterium]